MIHQLQKIRIGLKLIIYETLFARSFSFNTYRQSYKLQKLLFQKSEVR